MLKDPKEINIISEDGNEKTYVISKVPATYAREILIKYPTSGLPKIGEYSINEEAMFKLISYAAVPREGEPLRLNTRALIDNHVDGAVTLLKLEKAMFEYNYSFFRDGSIPTMLKDFVGMLRQLVTKTSMDLLQLLSPKGKQH